MNFKKILLLSIVFFTIVICSPHKTFAATPITSCAVITVAGSYIIQNDITATTSPCILVGVDNVNIDGQGHIITGSVGGGDEGIHIEDYINTTLSNIQITNFDKGISILNSNNILMQNINAYLSYNNIYMDTVASTTITGSTIASSTSASGIQARDVTGLRIASSTFADNNSRSIGILSPNSSSNITITGNTFTDDLGDDLVTFYGNQNNILVQNNSFTVTGGSSAVNFDTGVFTNTLVTNNVFNDTYAGIGAYNYSGSNNIFSYNTFNNVQNALYLSGGNASFIHNTVLGFGQSGVAADSGSDLSISDNFFDSVNQGGYGVNITNMSSSTIQNNQILNVNTGIHSDTIDNTHIINNIFATSTGDMISISNVTNGLTISGNTVTNPTGVAFIVSNADGRVPGNTLSFSENDFQSNVYPFAIQSVHNATTLHNTFRGPVWVYDDTGDNLYNDATSGNAYYNASGTPAYTLFNILDNNGNGYADIGTDLPFASTTVGTILWPLYGQDAHPATLIASTPPQSPAPVSSGAAPYTGGGSSGGTYYLPTTSPTSITPVAPTALCTAQTYPTKSIKIGAKNDPAQVRLLEQYLNTYENARLPVDGIYSTQDKVAVIKWQEKYASEILTPWNLTSGTGYIYTTSLLKFKSLFLAQCQKTTNRDLYIGMSGNDVQDLQQALIAKNIGAAAKALAKNGVTSYFGEFTKAALIEFQQFVGILPATGNYDLSTKAKLSI